MIFKSVNPVNNQLVETFPFETLEQIHSRIINGDIAFRKWREVVIEDKKTLIEKIAKNLRSNVEECAKAITMEMGKPITQSRAEVLKCATLCDHYASNTSSYLKPRILKANSWTGHITYEPLGIILGIMPWNFPFWQGLRFAIPALFAGNSVLLKPSPNVPRSNKLLEDLLCDILPIENVFQVIFADIQEVDDILFDNRVQGVALTGSDKAGAAVAGLAGNHIKKAVLELGGNDAFIILKDADLSKAAKFAVASRMYNSGQTCISAKRFIVEESIQEEFERLLKKEMEKLEVGNPMLETTDVSALARPDLCDTLEDQVKRSLDLGAIWFVEGGKMEGAGNYYKPGILKNITSNMPAYKEELFGPVASLLYAKNEEDAIRIANDSKYGLGAAIWTEDINKARMLAAKLEVGSVAINGIVKSDPALPFGGVKKSGFGRELAGEGLLEFVNIKSTVIN